MTGREFFSRTNKRTFQQAPEKPLEDQQEAGPAGGRELKTQKLNSH